MDLKSEIKKTKQELKSPLLSIAQINALKKSKDYYKNMKEIYKERKKAEGFYENLP